MNLTLTIVMISANVLGAGMALPQAHRLARTKRAEGVSAAWAGISVVMNGWWFAYGVAADRWALLPVSAISVALYSTIAVVLAATGGRRTVRDLALAFAFAVSVPAVFLAIGGWEAAGVAVGVGYGVQLLPAVIATFRSTDLAGVSFTTWAICAIESGLWALYGLLPLDPALLIAGFVGIVMSAVIMGRLVTTGHGPAMPTWARWRTAEADLSW